MLMDPPVMQVDCQLQNDVDKTSSIGYDRKHTLSHDDYVWAGSDIHTTNDAMICGTVEDNNASQTRIDEVLDPSSDNSHVNMDDLPQGSELRKTNNKDDSYSNDVRFQLNISTRNTGQKEDDKLNEQSLSMVDVHHPQDEAHPPPSTMSLPGPCESNGNALPSEEEKMAEEHAEVDGNVNAASKEVGTDLDGCHAVQKELQCTLQDLSEIACTIGLGPNKSSLQEEKETSVSPVNDMDQPVHNNRCNGGTSTGNYGDEEDHAVALWVKWRGKWQTGIRCCRVDYPLPTLKAKPTHDRKSYIVVFFPRTRTYSWVDMLLVLPIEQYPLPLVNGTHRKWRNLVKDLSVPRRFIMQKLAILMLNFIDELHIEAVIENARKATTWKEFAQEASCCKDYTELGKMLIKLRNMILPDYISGEWLQSSFELWSEKCNNAYNAETIEVLYEELRDSVLWNKIDELWNASKQPELVPEWKTWKQEVMKQFFSLHPAGNAVNFGKNNNHDDLAIDQQVSRKRPKLEVRRGETQVSHMGEANCRAPSEDPNQSDLPINSVLHETVGALDSRNQHNAATFPSNSGGQEIAESGCVTPVLQNGRLELDSFKSSRQCSAYIEAKGRQCGRWANDGDIYCCVHQSMHFIDHSSKEDKLVTVETPLCSGMTNMGRKCKHRAQHGSIFCKKHRFQTNLDTMQPETLFSSSEVLHGREESSNKQEISNSNALYSIGAEREKNSQVAMQVKLVQSVSAEISSEKGCVAENIDLCTASTSMANTDLDTPLCIGILSHDNIVECQDLAKRHTLYCEKHLPKFLKRARDGKSRLISKDVFINILKGCTSRKDKICLHQACEFLYSFLRNNLSHQRSNLAGDHMPQILALVSKNPDVGEFLLKLISTEREKLANLWGFGMGTSKPIYSENQEGSVMLQEGGITPSGLKCKICAHEFSDDQALGLHWTDVHRKEARWLFRGYSCAACMDSFTNRKVLERHVQERHGAQYVQFSTLIRCMSCNSNFLNTDLLYQHIVSDHAQDFRLLDVPQRPKSRSVPQTEGTSSKPSYDNVEKDDGSQKLICKLCGLRFDLLPDLSRHHQIAHMNPSAVCHGKYQLNRGRHYYSAFKKSLRPTSTLKKRSSSGVEKNLKFLSPGLSVSTSQIVESETASLGKLPDYQCSDVAQALFSKIQKTRPHPSNLDILSVARSVCCKTSLVAALEPKYGPLPENIFVKAAKLCSDVGIQIDWHQEGFMCPLGCKSKSNSDALLPIQPTPVDLSKAPAVLDPSSDNEMWDMEEYHYVLDSEHFGWKLKNVKVVLCEDVSFGRERVPIVCAIDVEAKDSVCVKPEELLQHGNSVPWQGFQYITERLVDSSLIDSENSLGGCACSDAQCSPEKCDHVSRFDSFYENLVDIHGSPLRGRFAYGEDRKILLPEGYPVYECNSSCNCDTSCKNKVLQRGLFVKLELFRTDNKGWGIRAAEPIPQGTFVCEYIGEVVKGDEAMTNAEREAKSGCSYLLDIASQVDRERVQTVGNVGFMIDATRYGNVSRFINHSCSPNLNTRLVLVESKDCHLAHIGLFANRDIVMGEELAYDYGRKLVAGDGFPCHCGAKNCRGRVY
ncbi:hypothetical protein ACP4OV_000154 [Aristida adscensionis]